MDAFGKAALIVVLGPIAVIVAMGTVVTWARATFPNARQHVEAPEQHRYLVALLRPDGSPAETFKATYYLSTQPGIFAITETGAKVSWPGAYIIEELK